MAIHINKLFNWDKNIPFTSELSHKKSITLSGITYYGESLSNRKAERYKRLLGIAAVAFGTLCIIPSIFLATQGLYGKSIKWFIELKNNFIIDSKIKKVSQVSQKTLCLPENLPNKSVDSSQQVNNKLDKRVIVTPSPHYDDQLELINPTSNELQPVDSLNNSQSSSKSSLCPLNKKEEKIIKAQQVISDLCNLNPIFPINRYRVYYEKIPSGLFENFRQQSDNPWEKALEEGNEKTVKEFLKNPYFKGFGFIGESIRTVINNNYLSIFKLMVESKKIDLSVPIWSQKSCDSESLLLQLIKEGNKEEYIYVLLENNYDINLLEKDSHLLPDYQRLSSQCQDKIEHTIRINALNTKGYHSLEEAILNGDIEQVKESLDKGVCINHKKKRPLQLALRYYMDATPGKTIEFISKKLSSQEKEDLFKTREKIVNILLQHPSLRLKSTDGHLLTTICNFSHKPDNWESLCAQLIEKGVDPIEGNLIKLFKDLDYENLSEEGPIKKALDPSQKIIFQNCLNQGFINTLFELEDGNLTADVYKMLQMIWESFKTSDSMLKNFSLQTIERLSLSLNTIPLTFRKEQADELLKKVQKGIPVIIPAGWSGHATSIVIYKNKIIFGNVGEASKDFQHGLHIYEFEPNRLTSDLLASLPSTNIENDALANMLFKKLEMNSFESGIVNVLKAKKVNFVSLPSQTTGNCTWASSALLGFFSALFFLSHEEEGKDLKFIQQFIYNEFEPAAKLIALKKYIENHKAALNKAYINEISDLLNRLLMNYLKAAIEVPENEESFKIQCIYEAIDSLIYSGLKFTLYNSCEENKKMIAFLEKRYDLPWHKLEPLLTNNKIDYNKSYWGFYKHPLKY